ncbi:MAG: hypothetical protein NTY64_23775 [Deltaproteobacteria bacterium]|nr:hypothetical protein [Deltaproteobacteria bacterium]
MQPSTWSQTHTRARVEAIKAGKRGSTMCEVTEDALCVGANEADYETCDQLGRKLGAVLAESKEIRITSPAGTDIRGEVKARPVQYETGLFKKPGQFAAFPDSEINISPVEGTAEGKAVIDVSILSVGITVYDPVTVIITIMMPCSKTRASILTASWYWITGYAKSRADDRRQRPGRG